MSLCGAQCLALTREGSRRGARREGVVR